MTDDLDMGAILTGYRLDETIRLCLEAGNDIMMLCHRVPEIETVQRILGTLPSDQIERAQQHIGEFKKNLSPPQKFSESAFQEINARNRGSPHCRGRRRRSRQSRNRAPNFASGEILIGNTTARV